MSQGNDASLFGETHQEKLGDLSPDCSPEVALHQELILLSISAGEDEIILGADEPVEALEPVRLAHLLYHRRLLLHLHADRCTTPQRG